MSTRARVADLLRDHPVLDGHNDLLWAARELVGYDFDRLELTDSAACRGIGTHTDLPRLRQGGVGAQFWSVFVPATLAGDAAVVATLEQVDAAHTMIGRYADALALATTVEDVERAWRSGRVASLMGAEGGHQIGGSLGTLRMLHRLGVRYLTLTHNDNVPWADSATDEPVLGGLSDLGREVVAEMNRIGVLVDLSHTSADTMRDALDTTTQPVVFSHSSARAVTDHPRNVPDDVLGRLSGNGGLCMVTFVPHFVNQGVRDWDAEMQEALAPHGYAAYSPEEEALESRWAEEHPPPRASVADVVAHLEHVREVAGIEHVGLGGDYDGVGMLPDGLEDVTGYPVLLEALAERGWSDSDLAALTSRNVLRVMHDAGLTDAGEGRA
ncbi:membrane dipeptidase [Nocardioides scoriae]|uniref:Membrane dipeptidase n=1 Tax=Nocardioides scoriae TaxID=642780 RepID=A0A1H1PI10_9ACTN|nr:dipeptidase [Nocardioides scoriae]SDS10908.1 membrane dipeptidase [Nocardioides scoriae]